MRAAAAVGADEVEETKRSKELNVQTRSGTLIDFLDELDPTLIKHVAHCSMLSRQKAGSLAFDRDRRPGDISADIDFTETEIAKRRGKLSRSTEAQINVPSLCRCGSCLMFLSRS